MPQDFRDGLVALIPQMRAYAIVLTAGNRAAADDLVQDALVNALRAQHLYRVDDNFKAWLFTILRNRYRTILRRRRHEASILETMPHFEETPAQQEDHIEIETLRLALERLSMDQREALYLVVVQGLNYEQVASACGCEVGTIKSRISRARKRLRAMLLDGELLKGTERGEGDPLGQLDLGAALASRARASGGSS